MPTTFHRFAVHFVATLAGMLCIQLLATTNATAAVTATFKNKELTIWGDQQNNQVDISRIDRLNIVMVEAKTGRTRKTMMFPDAQKITINMSGGQDTVNITGNQLADFVSVRSEFISITDAMFAGDLQLLGSRRSRTGAVINIFDTMVLGDTFVDGTTGDDWLRLEDSQFAGLFQADLGDGQDDVYLNAKNSNVEFGKLTMFLGGGMDAIFYTINSGRDVIAHDNGSVVFGGMYWETSGNYMYNMGWNSPADDDVVPNLGAVYGFDE